MNALSKFGFFLISASSIGILILKILTGHHLFTDTLFYRDLGALAALFGFIVAIAVILILSPVMKSFILLLITFVLVLVVVYIFIVPAYVAGA